MHEKIEQNIAQILRLLVAFSCDKFYSCGRMLVAYVTEKLKFCTEKL